MSGTDPGIRTAPGWNSRRWRILGQILLGIVMFSGLGLLVLMFTGFNIRVPAPLADRVESRLNAALEVGHVELGLASLVLEPGQPLQLLLEDVRAFGDDDAEIARLDAVRTRLVPRQLLQGILVPEEIHVSGAQVTIRRDQDGSFALSTGMGVNANGSLTELLGDLDQTLDLGPLAQLSTLAADSLTVTVEDDRAGRRWQAEGGELTMRRSQDGLDLNLAVEFLNDGGELTSTAIRLHTKPDSPFTRLKANIDNAPTTDIAAQSPTLAFLEAFDATVSVTLTANLDGRGEVVDLHADLSVGQGVLQTESAASPFSFRGAELEVVYDQETRTLGFSRIEFSSESVTAAAEGSAILQEYRNQVPGALVGQLALSAISLNPRNLYDIPLRFEAGTVDFKVRFEPFRIDIGQMTLQDAGWHLVGQGQALAKDIGWDVAVDIEADSLPLDRLQGLWPSSVAPAFRDWFGSNLTSGEISELNGAVRMAAGQPLKLAVSGYFGGLTMNPPGPIPSAHQVGGYISIDERSARVIFEKGAIVPPDGGDIAIGSSVLTVSDLGSQDSRAEIVLQTESTITSVLSLLDLPPLELFAGTNLSPNLAAGRARLSTEVGFETSGGPASFPPSFNVSGQLLDLVSDTLVKNRRLVAPVLDVRANAEGIRIGGAGHLGKVPVNAIWSQIFGSGNRLRSRVEGEIELSQEFLDEFRIALPSGSVNGEGSAHLAIEMTGDGSPLFELESDLVGVGLQIRALGWSKPRDDGGVLRARGRLGQQARLDLLDIEAPGLSATGAVEFGPNLRFAQARFDRVVIGAWLDGALTLTGRDAGLPPAIAVHDGMIDLRSARLNMGGGGRSGPLTLALDRLVVSDTVSLTEFVGEFTTEGGLDGNFTASINGRSPVRGTLLPRPSGTAVQIESDQAGVALAELGLFRNARGGDMTMLLTPTGERGVYEGRLDVTSVQIVDAPVMTELLSAISIVGLLDQLSSGGITMSGISADFRLLPGNIVLHRSSAVGPSLGISLEGIYDTKNDTLDMQGVISPAYFLNAIGQLISRGGEGLFGFTFRLSGDPGNPRVGVNPLSILTPGMFREIFRAPPPTLP